MPRRVEPNLFLVLFPEELHQRWTWSGIAAFLPGASLYSRVVFLSKIWKEHWQICSSAGVSRCSYIKLFLIKLIQQLEACNFCSAMVLWQKPFKSGKACIFCCNSLLWYYHLKDFFLYVAWILIVLFIWVRSENYSLFQLITLSCGIAGIIPFNPLTSGWMQAIVFAFVFSF